MKVADIQVTNLSFSHTPDTLKRQLCAPAPKFKNTRSQHVDWFGLVALSLIEVATDEYVMGIGKGFTSVGTEVLDTYRKPLAIGECPFTTEFLWGKIDRSRQWMAGLAPLPHPGSALRSSGTP